jgi:hypothetical protein
MRKHTRTGVRSVGKTFQLIGSWSCIFGSAVGSLFVLLHTQLSTHLPTHPTEAPPTHRWMLLGYAGLHGLIALRWAALDRVKFGLDI